MKTHAPANNNDAAAPVLRALPADPTPDAGPACRGGPLAWAVALCAAALALGLGAALWRAGLKEGAAACLVAFGLVAARAGWILAVRLRCHQSLPRSHAVLADHLGFRIDFTCRDVVMTAFLDPDRLAAGDSARLLCFMENLASRQRVAVFDIGPHPRLGLTDVRRVRLHLAAGQAAVYALPLRVAADFAPGEHDLPVTMRIERPSGDGLLLPGARRHLHNLWTVHFAAPFTVDDPVAGGVVPPGNELASGSPVYLSLGSVSDRVPDLGPLERLLSDRP